LDNQIEENLKRAYGAADDQLPERFRELLDQLRQPDTPAEDAEEETDAA
jgi:hypothetical protein